MFAPAAAAAAAAAAADDGEEEDEGSAAGDADVAVLADMMAGRVKEWKSEGAARAAAGATLDLLDEKKGARSVKRVDFGKVRRGQAGEGVGEEEKSGRVVTLVNMEADEEGAADSGGAGGVDRCCRRREEEGDLEAVLRRLTSEEEDPPLSELPRIPCGNLSDSRFERDFVRAASPVVLSDCVPVCMAAAASAPAVPASFAQIVKQFEGAEDVTWEVEDEHGTTTADSRTQIMGCRLTEIHIFFPPLPVFVSFHWMKRVSGSSKSGVSASSVLSSLASSSSSSVVGFFPSSSSATRELFRTVTDQVDLTVGPKVRSPTAALGMPWKGEATVKLEWRREGHGELKDGRGRPLCHRRRFPPSSLAHFGTKIKTKGARSNHIPLPTISVSDFPTLPRLADRKITSLAEGSLLFLLLPFERRSPPPPLDCDRSCSEAADAASYASTVVSSFLSSSEGRRRSPLAPRLATLSPGDVLYLPSEWSAASVASPGELKEVEEEEREGSLSLAEEAIPGRNVEELAVSDRQLLLQQYYWYLTYSS